MNLWKNCRPPLQIIWDLVGVCVCVSGSLESFQMIPETNYRWMPLILLLIGSMFAHCGVGLFPSMVIEEVRFIRQMRSK